MRALIIIRRSLHDEKAAQGLRAAVAYAAVGVAVTVALVDDKTAAPAKTARHLATLRALEQTVLSVDEATLGELLCAGPWHAVVVW